jgi:hypothetical protein
LKKHDAVFKKTQQVIIHHETTVASHKKLSSQIETLRKQQTPMMIGVHSNPGYEESQDSGALQAMTKLFKKTSAPQALPTLQSRLNSTGLELERAETTMQVALKDKDRVVGILLHGLRELYYQRIEATQWALNAFITNRQKAVDIMLAEMESHMGGMAKNCDLCASDLEDFLAKYDTGISPPSSVAKLYAKGLLQ